MSEQKDPLSHRDSLYNGNNIRTFNGKYVDVFNPDIDTIDIIDIAHALSNTCRFGGHTYQFYSVAQHSAQVASLNMVPDELKLTALLHDATEAYMCDIPRPIKRNLQEYKKVEDKLMEYIAKKFNLVYPFPDIIKAADNYMLEFEHKHIIIEKNATCLPPASAERDFLYYFKLYTGS